MKHDRLCAIAHNFADSMASGLGFVVGYCPTDVFGEAAASPLGVIEIDFLHGWIVDGVASLALRSAAAIFAEAFPDFCRKNGAEAADFRCFTVRFYGRSLQRYALLGITDSRGRRSTTAYGGFPLKRLLVRDSDGRIRKKRRQVEMDNR